MTRNTEQERIMPSSTQVTANIDRSLGTFLSEVGQQSAAEDYRHSDDYPVTPCPGCGRPGREYRKGLHTCTQDPDACAVHSYEATDD